MMEFPDIVVLLADRPVLSVLLNNYSLLPKNFSGISLDLF